MRHLLEKNGIDINSAVNGVFLPKKEHVDWPGQITHNAFNNFDSKGRPMFRHGKLYVDYVKDEFERIDRFPISKEAKRRRIIAFLEDTRSD